MKYFLLIILIFTLNSCKNRETQNYYIVGKTYEKEHMCHSDYQTINYAIVVIPPQHKHKLIFAKYTLHIANKNELLHINVNETLFNKYNVKDKILY